MNLRTVIIAVAGTAAALFLVGWKILSRQRANSVGAKQPEVETLLGTKDIEKAAVVPAETNDFKLDVSSPAVAADVQASPALDISVLPPFQPAQEDETKADVLEQDPAESVENELEAGPCSAPLSSDIDPDFTQTVVVPPSEEDIIGESVQKMGMPMELETASTPPLLETPPATFPDNSHAETNIDASPPALEGPSVHDMSPILDLQVTDDLQNELYHPEQGQDSHDDGGDKTVDPVTKELPPPLTAEPVALDVCVNGSTDISQVSEPIAIAVAESFVPEQAPLSVSDSTADADSSASPATIPSDENATEVCVPRGIDNSEMPCQPELLDVQPIVEADADEGTTEPNDDGQVGEEDPTRSRAPRRFRPFASAPSRPTGSTRRVRQSKETAERERALPIGIRILERRGLFKISLLPRRADGLPETIVASGTGDPGEIVALQEEWYQDVALPNLGVMMREGIEWEATLKGNGRVRWSLSGRDLFVFAGSETLSGFVNVPRISLGEDHVVLCVEEYLEEAQEAIRRTGSETPTLHRSEDGIPTGWVGLKGVHPKMPAALSQDGHIFDSLCPQPQVEIVLAGGIRLERSTWLAGFPPRIYVRGIQDHAVEVAIDGVSAVVAVDGSLSVPGWDAQGDHNVWCGGVSKTYRVQVGAEDWPTWNAYSWSLGEAEWKGGDDRSAICGALVMPPTQSNGKTYPVLVPSSNPVLLGAQPGQVYICAPRRDMSSPYCTGNPPFKPVWALPVDPFRCSRGSVAIVRIGDDAAAPSVPRMMGSRRKISIRSWVSAILNASRKGLETDSSDPIAKEMWSNYKQHARLIWRSIH